MKRVNINLWQPRRKHRLLGLSLYEYEGTEELRKVAAIIEESLAKHFPNAEIIRSKAVRELFQEGE